MDQDIIRSISIFSSLPDEEVEHLAETLDLKEIPQGTLLLEEDALGDRYYILVDGEVEVLKALGTADERLLGVRRPGSFIGEMSLFSEDSRHTASVRARTALQLLEMSPEDLGGLLNRQPKFVYEMMRVISQRLDESENITIQELRQKNIELTQAYEELKAAQVEIIEKEKLEKELEVARDIQLSILPREFPQCPRLDFGACIVPMAAVGGDFYDFIAVNPEQFVLVVGDVVGHGVRASLMMAQIMGFLRTDASHRSRPGDAVAAQLAACAARIRADRVQLNTATRPPAEEAAIGVPRERMERLAEVFNPRAEVIADFRGMAAAAGPAPGAEEGAGETARTSPEGPQGGAQDRHRLRPQRIPQAGQRRRRRPGRQSHGHQDIKEDGTSPNSHGSGGGDRLH